MGAKTGLPKVAKGVAYGDVSNISIRNVLTEISKSLYGDFTRAMLEESMEFFGWRCPYTDRYLKDDYDARKGTYAVDHVYPQNRIWCGLNVKGNLLLVDKDANNAKGSQTVEDFLTNDTKVLGNLDSKTRRQRLEKIEEFQKQNNYNPTLVSSIIGALMQQRYDQVRAEQEQCILQALSQLKQGGVVAQNTSKAITGATSAPKATPKASSTNQFDSFVTFAKDVLELGKATINSYKSWINKVTREMGINNLDELEKRIGQAIDYCDSQIKDAEKCNDDKKAKSYRDCRSALNKYNVFLANKASN